MIGDPISRFEDKLPRAIDVLRYYYHFECNVQDTEKICHTTKQIHEIYHRARIPTIHFESIRSKIKRLVTSVKSVIETRKSKLKTQMHKESNILEKLMRLFEVTQNEGVLSFILKDFLEDQRTTRGRFIRSLSVVGIASNQQLPARSNSYYELSQSHSVLNVCEESMEMEIEESDVFELSHDYDESPDFAPPHSNKSGKLQLCKHDMKELSKCVGSYRTMEKVLAIGIKAAGKNPNDYAISKTTLCSEMNKLRAISKSGVIDQISSSNEKVIIHFDGKSFAKINAKHIGKDSRMVAVCHTRKKNTALGLPILESGSAETYAWELIGLCENFNLSQRVVGLGADTANTNTGEKGGVCTKFEQEIGRDVLFLACRHHIHETILRYAFTEAFGVIDAPTTTLVDVLKENWQHIKEQGFRYAPCDEFVYESEHLQSLYNNAMKTLQKHSKCKFLRDDYSELNDLCLKFFGIQTMKTFMVPGSNSKARWMSKAIYGMKMYLFREEMEFSDEFRVKLLEFALFVAVIYCKFWNRCTNAPDAPVNDLELIKELRQYSTHNPNMANAVLTAFEKHLWYLGDELVPISLFSDKVSIDDKNKMRRIISNNYTQRNDNSRRLKNYIEGMELSDLVTSRSGFIFSLLEIDIGFLLHDAATWELNLSYSNAKKCISELIIVVNDEAERALGRANRLIRDQKVRSEARLQNMFLSMYSD